jgi:ABC-type Fe3+/spermidine/putrescine transport system ATPase subunit
MVFQNYALFPHMTVAENVAFGLRLKKWPKEKIRERVNYLLSLVHLEGLGERHIDRLSGGQQQRVAVARALSVEPKVLLMDEPLSNLDANLRLIMREEIRKLQERIRITTIFVTHDQYEAMSISDRMVVLQGGGIAQIGSPVEVYQRPATDFIAGFVGYVNFVPARVKSVDAATQETLAESEFGPLTLALEPGRAQPGQEVTLVIRPESINLDRPGPEPGPNAFTGTVETFMYGGALAKCTVSLGPKKVIVDQYDPREDRLFRPGDQVTVMIPRNVHVLGKKL